MSENEKKEVGKTEPNRPNREKTRKMLMIYALVFVGVVLLLVLVTILLVGISLYMTYGKEINV